MNDSNSTIFYPGDLVVNRFGDIFLVLSASAKYIDIITKSNKEHHRYSALALSGGKVYISNNLTYFTLLKRIE